MDKRLFTEWQRYVPDLAEVLRKMDETAVIAVGVSPYPRIMPALFMKNYSIYSVKNPADLDVLREYAPIFSLEERHPKIAEKVHATGYLIRNYTFRGFLNSRRGPFKLLFYQTTRKIIDALNEFNIGWIGNDPDSFSGVVLKGDFRDLVKQRGLPSIPDLRLSREDFLTTSFEDIWKSWNRPFVVQRADFDVAGEMGTFFITTGEDLEVCKDILGKDERYHFVTISPFITGNSLSMLGCVTEKGVLSSTLQLQLIDVPESLHGQLGTGVFLGHDWAFRDWSDATERTAQAVVESIGAYLAERGFKGIFGIDFLYDTATQELFPIECNPRFTGALPVYSLMVAANGVPTIEFFHLLTHLGIHSDFDFEQVNAGLKLRTPIAHIALTPKGIYEMKHDLKAGVYSYRIEEGRAKVRYERPGAFYWDFKADNEFILIDSLPRRGGSVIQNVPRMCKLIFPRGIATSTKEVKPEIGILLTALSEEFRVDQTAPQLSEGEVHGEE